MQKKKRTKKNTAMEVKYEELDQHDYAWDEDLMLEKEEKYAACIGKFLIWFSNLEHSLDIEIANLISDRAHDDGYIVIKDLEMFEKIELFYNLAFPRVHHADKRRNQKVRQLNLIRKQLEDLTVLRNKIAHAKWNTLDKEGYVRVDTKTNKDNGFIRFKKLKITPLIMKRGTKQTEVLIEKIDTFIENMWV